MAHNAYSMFPPVEYELHEGPRHDLHLTPRVRHRAWHEACTH